MELNSWPGFIAVILAVISFYGTTYLVIALNTGWRFGYWLSSACFGALMVLLSIFWIVNPVGPQGALPRWVPVAAGADISQVEFNGQSLEAPARYPGDPWEEAEAGDRQAEDFASSVATCITASEETLAEEAEPERSACLAAQQLKPPVREIPVLDGTAVAVEYKPEDIRFAEDNGTLAQATIVPLTTDPRISEDPDGEPLAEPFRVVAILDEGSLRVPAYGSLAIFTLYAAFHLWGLNRAERRKMNPAIV